MLEIQIFTTGSLSIYIPLTISLTIYLSIYVLDMYRFLQQTFYLSFNPLLLNISLFLSIYPSLSIYLDIYVLEIQISTTGWNSLIVIKRRARDKSTIGQLQGVKRHFFSLKVGMLLQRGWNNGGGITPSPLNKKAWTSMEEDI